MILVFRLACRLAISSRDRRMDVWNGLPGCSLSLGWKFMLSKWSPISLFKKENRMSIQSVPNTDLEYYLVAYDKDGRERSDDPDGLMSERVARAIRDEPVTDVF